MNASQAGARPEYEALNRSAATSEVEPSAAQRVRVLLVDDHPIVIRALTRLLSTDDLEVVGSCTSGYEAIEFALALRADVVVLDLDLPDANGVSIVRRLNRMEFPGSIVLIASEVDEADTLEAIRLGVRGIVLKSQAPEDFVSAVRGVAAGGRWLPRRLLDATLDSALSRESARQSLPSALTPREFEVMRLVGLGYSNKRIAREMGISEGTAKVHLNNVFRKLAVTSRLQLALAARVRGLI